MVFRASQIGKLMTNPRKKSENLSETAKSYIRQLAKQDFYGYESDISTKQIRKGIHYENESIKLLNEVRETKHEKNTERKFNDFLTGEPDIITISSIIDIKTSWSLETFPATSSEGESSLYEWQLRAYMWLFEKPSAELIYCMIDTDDEFLNDYDNLQIHKVAHIKPSKRLTILNYTRDTMREDMMSERLKICSDYYSEYINELNNK